MPANLHVLLIIFADWNIRMQDIGDPHSDIIAFLDHLPGVRLQILDHLSEIGYLVHDTLELVFVAGFLR